MNAKCYAHSKPLPTSLSGALASKRFRYQSQLRRSTTPNATGDPNGFERNAFQQKLKDADDAVKKAQSQFGSALMDAIGPVGQAMGMGSTKNKGAPQSAEDDNRDWRKWSVNQAFLVERKLESLEPKEVEKLTQNDFVLVVVMPKEDYTSFHPKGSINVPLNQYITTISNPLQLVRRAAYGAQGVRPIEPNPRFEEELVAACRGAKGVILACNSGGTIRPTTNFPQGQASRSLLAASIAMRNPELGSLPIKHLQGGLNTWFRAGLPGEGEAGEWEDTSGRTPYVPGFTVEQDAEELKQ